MSKFKNILFLFLFIYSNSYGQIIDSLSKNSILKKVIVPTSLIVVGSIISNSDFEQNLQIDLRNKVGNNYENKIDNFILFAPVGEIYLADILGVKSKNHWFDQSKNLFISNVISSLITNRLKVIVGKTRPNGEPLSFPSGHTTIAFTNATVLYEEFKNSSPILAYSGYAFAIGTGGFRMINNKHFLSDVLMGAGVGILVTKLVYHFEPFKNFNPFKSFKNTLVIPQINNKNYGIYVSYSF
jgi:hypothetical protein